MINNITFEDELIEESRDIGSVADIFNLKNTDEKLYSQSIKHYMIDNDTYDEIYDLSNRMRTAETRGLNELPVFDKLLKDIFFALYKYKPELRRESKMKASTLINNEIMRALIETDRFSSVRRYCMLDLCNTSIGCELIAEKALEIFKELMKNSEEDLQETIEQALEAETELASIEEQMAELNNEDYNPDESEDSGNDNYDEDEDFEETDDDTDDFDTTDEEGIDGSDGSLVLQVGVNISDSEGDENTEQIKTKLAMSLEEAKKRANEAYEKMKNELEEEKIIDNVAERMNEEFKDIEKELKINDEFITNWGLDDSSDSGKKISFQDKKRALERIRTSKRLKDISKLIGRFKETALEDQKRKSKDGAVTIKSIATGNEIKNVLPSEKLLLVNDATKKNFYKKYNEKELLQYEVESHTVKSKGPMIVCIDTSESMRYEGGKNELWSKAVAVALLEVANLQKRNYAAIHFDTGVGQPIIIEKGTLDPNKVIDVAEIFRSGGTNFEKPLKKAIEIIKDSRFKAADIVFITDGESGISDKFLEEFKDTKKKKEFKVLGVCINIGGTGTSSTLREFCDEVIFISDLAELEDSDSNNIHKIFTTV